MSNIRRLYAEGVAVFITQVVQNRLPVFAELAESERLLEVLRVVKGLHPFALHGWVILPDHLHLLLTPAPGETQSTIMHSLKPAFTRAYKKAHGIASPLHFWQKRYWDTIITSDIAFRERLDYIHRNPVKHGLCHHPLEWRYSSIHVYEARKKET